MKEYATLDKVIADNTEMLDYFKDEYSRTAPGSDESRVISQNMKDCSASIIEAEKIKSELQYKEQEIKRDEYLRSEQIAIDSKTKKRANIQQLMIEGAKLSVWMGVTIFLASLDFEFEKENVKTFSWARKTLDMIMKKSPV